MRKILTLFLVIAMLFSLSACGEKTSQDSGFFLSERSRYVR